MSKEAASRCLESLDVLVLAGGLGTRLRAAIGETPKLLAPVGGQPYLAYLLEWVRRFGARRIILSLGYKADAVLEFLSRQPVPDLEIVTLVEPEPLGTAGAVRFARSELRTDPVLIMNGDSYTEADLCALVARHRQENALGTLLCVEVANAGRYGRVAIDQAGRIANFVEKDSDFAGTAPISAGVYVISARLLDAIAAGTGSSIERDVFQALPPGTLAAMAGRYRFIDIGTPDSLARACEIIERRSAELLP
jgi:NDP-sugar pyrophosphorylase family protein